MRIITARAVSFHAFLLDEMHTSHTYRTLLSSSSKTPFASYNKHSHKMCMLLSHNEMMSSFCSNTETMLQNLRAVDFRRAKRSCCWMNHDPRRNEPQRTRVFVFLCRFFFFCCWFVNCTHSRSCERVRAPLERLSAMPMHLCVCCLRHQHHQQHLSIASRASRTGY